MMRIVLPVGRAGVGQEVSIGYTYKSGLGTLNRDT